MTDSSNFLTMNWRDNREFLNWPGLQYLWYTKFKPAIYEDVNASIKEKMEMKSSYDDKNWYCSYNPETGEVYVVFTEDNVIFNQDGSIGEIDVPNEFGGSDSSWGWGSILLDVNKELSQMVDGFIDDHIGCIGHNSDQIGHATGRLYVNFNREYFKPDTIPFDERFFVED